MSSFALKVQNYVAEIRKDSGRWPDPRDICRAIESCTLDLAIRAIENVKRLWK